MLFQKILIATDGSVVSLKAAETGLMLASQLKASVGIVFVIDRSKEWVNADLGITDKERWTLLLKEGGKALTDCIEKYTGIGEVTRFMPEGNPVTEILRVALEWKADLIVMGRYGRSGLSRMMTGSVTDSVLRQAEAPVLVIPPGMRNI